MIVARKCVYAFIAIATIGIGAIAIIANSNIWRMQDVSSFFDSIMDGFYTGVHEPIQYANEFPEIDWTYWQEANKDVIGWISVKGTLINQAIVQARNYDPSFYLNHDLQGKENAEGSVFLDAECEKSGLLSKNSVIFGHHLTNKRGFSSFADYSNKSFAQEHQTILLQTPLWKKKLKVLFVEITPGDSPTKVTRFDDEISYRLWMKSRFEASCVKLINTLDPNTIPERIWTFCTCSYTTYENERTLVYAAEL